MTQAEEKVADLMNRKPQTIDSKATAAECARKMAKSEIHYAVVVDAEQALGIITETDLVAKVMADALDPKKVLVLDIMSTPLITARPYAPVTEAAELMSEYRIRRIVVIDDMGTLVGIISADHLAKSLAEKKNFADASLNAIALAKANHSGGPYQ